MINLHNKAVKTVAGEQRQDHVTPFHHRLQIFKVKDLYEYEVAKLMHKNSRKKLPNCLNCHFTTVRAIRTRTMCLALSELNLDLSRCRTQKLQKSFKYQGAKIWNLVPYELKKLPLNQFKLKYKKICIVKLQIIHNSKLIEIDKSSSLIYTQRIQINMKN